MQESSPKTIELPRIIQLALRGNSEAIRKHLRENPEDLYRREPNKQATAFHLAAYCGHLEALKCLLQFGNSNDLLREDGENNSVLDVALDSRRPSAAILQYLLFEAKVPFGNKTLLLLKKKYDLFVIKIKEANSVNEANERIKQLNYLLEHAGHPEWELRRRTTFAKPRLSSLADITATLIKSRHLDDDAVSKLPHQIKQQITYTPQSLKYLTAFAVKNKVPGSNELSTDQLNEECLDAIKAAIKL
ncbi:ankyrin repeat domain-containing protein [Legionella sp. WA2022007384]